MTGTLMVRAQPTIVSVNPPLTAQGSAQIGQTFTIDINIADATGLAAWSVTLVTTSAVLYTNESMISEGPFLSQTGTYQTKFEAVKEVGWWRIGAFHNTSTPAGGVSGSGTLASVAFRVEKAGSSAITLLTTSLGDPNGAPISHTNTDGFFSNWYDVAVWGVDPAKTLVGQGLNMKIEVPTRNLSNITQTYSVTAYANATAIQTLPVTNLPPGDGLTLTFTWNTAAYAQGVYIISANASTVSGEADTDNNSYTDGTVKVNLKGDLDDNCVVNILDILRVAVSFGWEEGDPDYDPIADVDGSGVTNILDILAIAVVFGASCP
jgi:hypothetical protein